MRGLSIRQPWADAVLKLGKRLENRTWSNSPGLLAQARKLVGQTLALHASAGCTRAEYEEAVAWMQSGGLLDVATMLPPLAGLTRGAIVGTFRLADVVLTTTGGHRAHASELVTPCLLCEQWVHTCGWTSDGNCRNADRWAMPGLDGLVLADVQPLEVPVPWKGALGFFNVPDEVLR